MILELQNENDNFLKAVKYIAKLNNVKIKIINKENDFNKEYKNLISDYKKGKIKAFDNTKDAFKDAGLL